jgi:hypothetical protein
MAQQFLTVLEYAAQLMGNGFMKFDVAYPLRQQRMLIDELPTVSAEFRKDTTLIQLTSDCDCWVSVSNPSVDLDLRANTVEYLGVVGGAGQLSVIAEPTIPSAHPEGVLSR